MFLTRYVGLNHDSLIWGEYRDEVETLAIRLQSGERASSAEKPEK